MNLQPSNSLYGNERRILFAWELAYGGSGQFPMSATSYTADPSSVIYTIDFLTESTISSVGFRDTEGTYSIDSSLYEGWVFPAGTTWTAPITSIELSNGTAIAYTYEINNCIVDPPF